MNEASPATMLHDRAVLRLAGPDVSGFLQSLVTQDMNGPFPAWAGLLTPQGKALFDFIIWSDGDDILLDCEADAADSLSRRLALYRLRRPITIERDNTLAVHWSPTFPALTEPAAAGPTPDPRLPLLGYRWVAEPAGAASKWRSHRLGHGVAEGVAELGSGETLWLECNGAELNGVSFVKGCYVGQENTARMHYRAKVNRRLVIAPISDDDDRAKVRYPDLGLMVTHRRVDALGDAIRPDWLQAALNVTG